MVLFTLLSTASFNRIPKEFFSPSGALVLFLLSHPGAFPSTLAEVLASFFFYMSALLSVLPHVSSSSLLADPLSLLVV